MKTASGAWDFEDMEEKAGGAQNPRSRVLLPAQHPTGRVWARWELERAMELFREHEVYVIPTRSGRTSSCQDTGTFPLQSVSAGRAERTAALLCHLQRRSHLAGLVSSYRIIYNKTLRGAVEKGVLLSHYNRH
jgi:cystathionine beta-lyase